MKCCVRIEQLGVSGTRLSDDTLDVLSKRYEYSPTSDLTTTTTTTTAAESVVPQLKMLMLDNCERVTSAGVLRVLFAFNTHLTKLKLKGIKLPARAVGALSQLCPNITGKQQSLPTTQRNKRDRI